MVLGEGAVAPLGPAATFGVLITTLRSRPRTRPRDRPPGGGDGGGVCWTFGRFCEAAGADGA